MQSVHTRSVRRQLRLDVVHGVSNWKVRCQLRTVLVFTLYSRTVRGQYGLDVVYQLRRWSVFIDWLVNVQRVWNRRRGSRGRLVIVHVVCRWTVLAGRGDTVCGVPGWHVQHNQLWLMHDVPCGAVQQRVPAV